MMRSTTASVATLPKVGGEKGGVNEPRELRVRDKT
jgi:hypothetical protein